MMRRILLYTSSYNIVVSSLVCEVKSSVLWSVLFFNFEGEYDEAHTEWNSTMEL